MAWLAERFYKFIDSSNETDDIQTPQDINSDSKDQNEASDSNTKEPDASIPSNNQSNPGNIPRSNQFKSGMPRFYPNFPKQQQQFMGPPFNQWISYINYQIAFFHQYFMRMGYNIPFNGFF